MNKKLIILGVVIIAVIVIIALIPKKEKTADVVQQAQPVQTAQQEAVKPSNSESVFSPDMEKSYAEGEKAAYLSGIHMKAGTADSCSSCHTSNIIDDSERDINAKCVECHQTLDEVAKLTEGEINPHSSHLGTMNCTTCHTGHTPSKAYCLNCHEFDMNISAGGNVENVWYEDLSQYANAKPTRVEKTDIVVVGTGATGFTAAITALNKGKKVIMLEKMPIVGGNSQLAAGGMNAAGTRFQKAKNIPDTPEIMFNDTMKGGKNINNPELVKILANESSNSIEWLASIDAELGFIAMGGGATYPRFHGPTSGDFVGPFLSAKLRTKVAEDGADVRVNSKVVKLLTNEAGDVTGVLVKGKHSGIYQIDAKAVILASGGFGANNDLVASYRPDAKGVQTSNQPGTQGDGVVLGTAIGAATVDMKEIQLNPTMLVGSPVIVSEIVRGAGGIFVNREGKRFISELTTRDVTTAAIREQTGASCFIVFDDTVRNNVKQTGAFFQLGKVKQGKSLDELANALGIPADALNATVARFNTMVEKGKDEDFGRHNFAQKIEGPNFYAIEVKPAIHYCMGGLKIDEKARVINTEGKVIKGLYAGGEVTGGVHGANRLGGNSISETITFGRIAGSEAADLK